MTFPYLDLAAIQIAHYVSDFWLQPRSWAENKHKSLNCLTLHSLTYAVPFVCYGYGYYIYNVLAHWVVDFITSRLIHKYMRQNNRLGVIRVFGLDQTLHFINLTVSYFLIYKGGF